MIWIRDDLRPLLASFTFEQFLALPGTVRKQHPDGRRRTVAVTLGGHRFFLKANLGPGWRGVLRALLSPAWPVLDTRPEVRALQRLPGLGIGTMRLAAWGVSGRNPAARRSFLLTDALENHATLEHAAPAWFAAAPLTPERVRLKHALTARVAETASRLHAAGLVHRDFYLCHLLVRLGPEGAPPAADNAELALVDLHRVGSPGPGPWRRRGAVRDLGGLLFSCQGFALSRRDRLRFIRAYAGRPLRECLTRDAAFWAAVERRAARLRRRLARHHQK